MSVIVYEDGFIVREYLLEDSEWKEVQVHGQTYSIQKHCEGVIDIYCVRKPNIFQRLIRRLSR